jgi:CheY-like chemotaxis protein/anti-sigma regulatory factor (Ser/Thr protein kinase)
MNDTEKSRVLLVEDDPIVRAFIVHELGRRGYTVIEADSALAARNIVSYDTRFDCILLDLGLPDSEGLDLLAELREQPGLRNVPFVLESGRGDAADIQAGLAAGAYYYLRKPLDAGLLGASVQAASEWGKLIREDEARDERSMQLLRQGNFHLRTFDEARDLARSLAGMGPKRKTIQLVIQELLFNAIEHGNLAIDYNAKGALLVADALHDEIKRRLADPVFGARVVNVDYSRQGRRLSVMITDQGDGFNWSNYLQISDERAYHPHGRGLPMANAMADEITFSGRGNIVTAQWYLPE